MLADRLRMAATVKSIPGQQLYDTPGTYTFTVPTGVTSISVCCIGSGGGSAPTMDPATARGGGGGGLAYVNNHTCTPGATYTVFVATGGTGNGNGAYSRVYRNSDVTTICQGDGGASGASGGTGGGPTIGTGGTGGTGGAAAFVDYAAGGGGGGAGGYSGNGGNGGNAANGGTAGSGTSGTGGAGGGGGGANAYDFYFDETFGQVRGIYYGHGGGGVGIKGAGSSGAGGGGASYNANGTVTPGSTPGGGSSAPTSATYLNGGKYGGGGCGGYEINNNGYIPINGVGADGAVRIIWGTGRSYPNNAADV